jgi:dTDP-4-amino-4,6-dideoxygalactose transaminase
MDWKIQLSELNYDWKEADSVRMVIESEWLTMGNLSIQFEKAFQDFIGHQHQGVFVSSATAGLHLILMALGLKPGDEVILPALTFVSDANVVLQLGATPIFCDSISLENFNISEQSIIEKVTEKTKCIIIVHFAGYPMDLEGLFKFAREKNILLIEDCAHAPGASLNGKNCGNMSDASFFSFFSNKNLAIGEGGMVFSQDENLLKKIRSMRSHGMSAPTLDRHEGRAFSYDVENIGLNYRADEIRAALGIEQLKKLNLGNVTRKKISERYRKKLENTQVVIPFSQRIKNQVSAHHIMPIILPACSNRSRVMQRMKNEGIQTSIHYPAFSSFAAYSSYMKDTHLPITDEICQRELTLPLHPRMSFEDVDLVVTSILECI